jgi:hypothetical protein
MKAEKTITSASPAGSEPQVAGALSDCGTWNRFIEEKVMSRSQDHRWERLFPDGGLNP